MQIEALRSLRSVAAPAVLSLGLALSYAHLALAGVSNFSISSPATIVPGTGNKQVRVTGTVTCPSGKAVTVGITIVQQGKKASHALGETRGIPCDTGTVSNWELIAASSVPMQAGPASALANAWACIATGAHNPTGPCEFAHISEEITLK